MPKKAASNSAASARKPPSRDVAGAGVVGVGVVEALEVPAAVGGEGGDRVAAGGDQPPEVRGRGDAAGVAAAHADDRDRLLARARAGAPRLGHRGAPSPRAAPAGGLPTAAAVGWSKTRVDGQAQAGRPAEPVAQLDRGQRVEAEVLEGRRRVDRGGRSRGRARRRPARATSARTSPSRSASGAAARRSREGPAGAAARRRGAGRGGEERRQPPRPRLPPQGGEVERDRHRQGRRQRRGGGRRAPGRRRRRSTAAPRRAVRARSASSSSPAISLSRSQRPQAIERGRAGPAARRCWASASRKALAAA